MNEWIWWLLPIAVFFPVGSLFLGGSPIEYQGGGGVKHVLGLILSFALYLAVWFGVRAVIGGSMRTGLATVLAALVAVALLPLLCRLGFRIAGVKIVGPTFRGRADEHGAHG